MRLAYTEHTYWSAILGCKAVRLSVADERGQEFFMIVPRPDRGWADRDDGFGHITPGARAGYLEAISEATELGLPPGEVKVDYYAFSDA